MPETGPDNAIRIGVDVGGTFTDFALATPTGIITLKLPTTEDQPERAILDGISRLLNGNDIAADQVASIVHGTTLATNAIISRKGARTALVTTAGFRDVLELGDESRFDQYDINIQKPEPLVPRQWRFGIEERMSAGGEVLLPLDEQALADIAGRLEAEQIESAAICFLHAHINGDHEKRARERLRELLPSLSICLSSEVSPEIGEYGRFSTTAANAYVRPIMAAYLDRLEEGLGARGLTAPVFMLLSNGGLCRLDTAKAFPVRLVESGPAGGAVFAGEIARALGEEEVLAFDMGGTTAKICLIDGGVPRRSDSFEMARQHMHRQGSGLPARIPVTDLVEIGSGGGSIAHIDAMSRLHVGPESAGATPGPACYGRGGGQPTVTDADLLLGRLAADDFRDSGIAISLDSARRSIGEQIGKELALDDVAGAMAISEIVEEQMASAAREHAREKGVDVSRRSMIAFGGGAPLHAVNVAAKLGIDKIIVPEAAGIGSAIGFLQSQAVFEISRSIKMPLSQFDAAFFNRVFGEMATEARSVVTAAAPDAELAESRTISMRYRGQGHNLSVAINARDIKQDDNETFLDLFLEDYTAIYKRPLDGIEVECVGLTLRLSSVGDALPVRNIVAAAPRETPANTALFDLNSGQFEDVPALNRNSMKPGQPFDGPGLIKDFGTTICIPKNFSALLNKEGSIILSPNTAAGGGYNMADPAEVIRFQVIWNNLISIVEEQARSLMRTAFSPVVRDSSDLSAALFDRRGRMLAQAQTGTPGHVNSTAAAVPLMLDQIPVDRLAPGDHLITNDPWLASGHLHDITIASPVFREGALIGFFACTCHQLDIGGRGQGPDAASVFEEGLAIPVLKLVEGGRVNDVLMKIIRANVRTPKEVEADILSYVAANEASADTLLAALDKLGLSDLDKTGDEIIARSRAAMVEEIDKLPRAKVRNSITLDCFGTPVDIVCTLETDDGEMRLDFSGSSAASTRGVNLVYNYTNAYASYGARCIVGPQIPNNSGSLEPVKVEAPKGSILNVERPWPVCARHIIGQFLPEVVMGCLAQILPERVPAEGAACLWGIQLRGGPEIDRNFEEESKWGQDRYEVLFFNAGGTGARPHLDGLSATAFPSGVRAMPIEVVENIAPIVVWKKELRPDSAGDGLHRGGFGQNIELSTIDGRPCGLFAMFDRTNVAAKGREGGGNGATGRLYLKSGKPLDPKGLQLIGANERLCFELPGGGGFGPAEKRDPESLEADRRAGLVTGSGSPKNEEG